MMLADEQTLLHSNLEMNGCPMIWLCTTKAETWYKQMPRPLTAGLEKMSFTLIAKKTPVDLGPRVNPLLMKMPSTIKMSSENVVPLSRMELLIKFFTAQMTKFLLIFLFVILKMPLSWAEKTICERRLAALPPGLFYYQRIELHSAAHCAERCVDDWEFCRSAVLIEDIRNKSLCQLYGESFESLIPLNLPTFAPLQTDPNRLLPITLVELTDAPCSSKFARQSTIFEQLSAGAREQLRMIPGPAGRNRLEISTQSQKPTVIENVQSRADSDLMDQQQEPGNTDEAEHAAKASDQTYLAPFSSVSSFSQQQQQQQHQSSSSFSNGYVVPLGHHQPAPLQFPPNGLPIQPVIVSRGNQQQYNNNGCPNGICPKMGAKQPNNNDDNEQIQPPPCAARKSSDPCAPQAQWMEWSSGSISSCSVTCGSGWRERRRYCSHDNQQKCKGETTDREKCEMPACNQWTEWTEWTRCDCSNSCGGGQQMKRRTCQNGDQCVGASVESRPCNNERCPTWSNWGSWTECTATCGPGTQRRVRECEPRSNDNSICAVGNALEHRECELRSCPEWSQWEAWSTCSKSCGAGESVRRRECRNAASKDECQGAAVERLLCNTQLCPTWSTWTEWSSCSKSCGTGGTQTRKRECRYNGMFSDECTGAANDEKHCKQLGACPKWTEWAEWSDCTTTCGNGQQSRLRKCLPSGYGCAGNAKDVRSCHTATCPYFDQWSEWGGCSVSCGRGFCERKRKCIKSGIDDHDKKLVPADGLMPIREEMVEGTKGEKGPEDITSLDTIRPRTLEVIQSASIRRSPLISTKLGLLDESVSTADQRESIPIGKQYDTKIVPINAGECVGPSVERKACDAGPCCYWSQWSPWSNCIVQCGSTGYRDRTRRCELTQMAPTTTTKTEDDDAAGIAQQPALQQFGALRTNAFGGVLRCAICVGESRQTESCAITAPKSDCEDPHNKERRLPNLPVLRTKATSDLLLLREDIGMKEDGTYITAGKFGRRALDNEKRNEADRHKNDEDERTVREGIEQISTKIKDERKRSSPTTTAEEEATAEVGAVTVTTAEADEQHNCAWTQWSAWSDCGGAHCSKKRSRTCDSPTVDKSKCQCDGNFVQQTKCLPVECQQNLNVLVDETASAASPASASSSSASFIKRLQLIPRHKASEAEKRRGEDSAETNGNDNFLLQPPLDFNDKLIRISGLRTSGGDQRVPSAVECAIDDWLEWSEWSDCEGFCGTRQGHRTRHRQCACIRGCAGITEESLSCTVSNCQ